MKLNNLNLKYLMRAHTVLGLFAIFLFYISTYFGTITVFLPYINAWENPSRHFIPSNEKNNLDSIVPRIIKEKELSNIIEINLPSFRDKALSINDEKSKTIYINPNTNKILNTQNETNFITNFFNEIHIGRNIPKVGVVLMGISSILMIFLSISGLILWFNNKKRSSKKEKFYLKWHKNLSLTLLPFILIFALTGSVLGFMLTYSSPLAYSTSNTKETSLRKVVAPLLFPKEKEIKSSKNAKMMTLSELQTIAQENFQNLEIQTIKIFAWNEENARIKFFGYLKNNRYLSGKINRMNIELSARTGEILNKKDLPNANVANGILSVFYFLHFIPDETLFLRIVYFFFGIIMAVSLSFGFLIYSDKKAKRAESDQNYYSILNKLAMATMIGVIPASSLVIFLYWYLPFDMFERSTWLTGTFYTLWAATLFSSVLKDNVLKVINHLLLLSSILLFLAVFFHGKITGVYPWVSYSNSMFDIFFVDIGFLLFALMFFVFFKKSNNIRFFQKYDGDRYENY